MKLRCCESLTMASLVILLMFSLWLSVVAQARVLPSTSSSFVWPSSSQKALPSLNSESVKPKETSVAASLRKIPPSTANPTQNKSKSKRMG
ncbi:hypothetical protein TIFTF001_028378 [Ficus carica]|uniref:Uncharacterized protein n=1 Tax=Ficus carica TaxID=3494 RepID=A0AA88DPZ0_FICCA|nr:hypothetical protein TIFTF001_028378 [Ficus carica]